MLGKFLQWILIGGMILGLGYGIFPDACWYLPRLLLGHNRAMYGTYRGVLLENEDGIGKAGTQLDVVVTLHPSTWETPMTAHGHHFEPLLPAHDHLGGTITMRWPDGTVEQFQVHGHEQDRGTEGQRLGLGYGNETEASLPVRIGGGKLAFDNLQSLDYQDRRTYAGTLMK